jgi:hypothetical protein
MDKEQVRTAITTIRTLWPEWAEFARDELPRLQLALASIRHGSAAANGRLTLPDPGLPEGMTRQQKAAYKRDAEKAKQQREAWSKKAMGQALEELHWIEEKWGGWDGLESRLEFHNEQGERLREAQRTVCRYAHREKIDTEPLKRLMEFHQWDLEQEVLLILSHVEDALDAPPATDGTSPAARPSAAPSIGPPQEARRGDEDAFSTDWPLGMKADVAGRRVRRGNAMVDFGPDRTLWEALVKLAASYPTRILPQAVWREETNLDAAYGMVSRLRKQLASLSLTIPHAGRRGYVLAEVASS